MTGIVHQTETRGANSAVYRQLYQKMLLARRAEERIGKEYFKDEIKTPVHLGIGSEAISVGVLQALTSGLGSAQQRAAKNVQVFGTYRNHNLYLTLSEDTDTF